MQKKKGISLIVLIITIIVMIILAGAIIITLSNNEIINRASEAVDLTNEATVKEIAEMTWGVAYAEGIRDVEDKEVDGVIVKGLQSRVEEELISNKIDITKYSITVTTSGVTIEKAGYTYYSTLAAAVNDVNNNTIGTNADATKADAVAGIYVSNGKTYVVLLKDTTEETRIQTSADMTINLGGHTLVANDEVGIEVTSGNIVIDGRLANSIIEITNVNTTSCSIQTNVDTNLTINGGTYIANSDGFQSIGINVSGTVNIYDAAIDVCEKTNGGTRTAAINVTSSGTITVSNCEIDATANAGYPFGVYNDGTATILRCDINAIDHDGQGSGVANIGTMSISDSEINATFANQVGYGVITGTNSVTTLSDCNIKAYSHFEVEAGEYTKASNGVSNNGTLTLNNCYVMGTHSGVQNRGTMDVNGGTYEGFNHGGIYFSGAGTTSYVSNATIRACNMPEGYTSTDAANNVGFYIGTQSNVIAYLDNCEITGTNNPFVLRGSSGEQNNAIYISNSKISGGKIRIDNDTLKLYIGRGNNFTADNTNRTSAVVVTDKVYTK